MRNTNIDLDSATQIILSLKNLYILEMCSVSTNGERVWPAHNSTCYVLLYMLAFINSTCS